MRLLALGLCLVTSCQKETSDKQVTPKAAQVKPAFKQSSPSLVTKAPLLSFRAQCDDGEHLIARNVADDLASDALVNMVGGVNNGDKLIGKPLYKPGERKPLSMIKSVRKIDGISVTLWSVKLESCPKYDGLLTSRPIDKLVQIDPQEVPNAPQPSWVSALWKEYHNADLPSGSKMLAMNFPDDRKPCDKAFIVQAPEQDHEGKPFVFSCLRDGQVSSSYGGRLYDGGMAGGAQWTIKGLFDINADGLAEILVYDSYYEGESLYWLDLSSKTPKQRLIYSDGA